MKRRLTALLVAIAAVLSVAAAAWAYLGATGSGAGAGGVSASGGTAQVSAGTLQGLVFPTGDSTGAGDVVATITNGGTSPIRVPAVRLDTTQGTNGIGSSVAACVSKVHFPSTSFTNGGAGWSIPAGGHVTATFGGSLTMDADAPDSCQGATFTVYFNTGS